MRFVRAGARRLEFITRIALAMGVVGLAAISVAPLRAAAEEIIAGEIIIEATALRPQVLLTELDRQVTFVNRSGQPVHVDFISRDPELHHVFQVQDRIWAIFHRSGRHPFEVHFRNPALADLHGAVEVVGDPYGRPDARICSGITVQGACIER
jgi:hypothetical protein